MKLPTWMAYLWIRTHLSPNQITDPTMGVTSTPYLLGNRTFGRHVLQPLRLRLSGPFGYGYTWAMSIASRGNMNKSLASPDLEYFRITKISKYHSHHKNIEIKKTGAHIF